MPPNLQLALQFQSATEKAAPASLHCTNASNAVHLGYGAAALCLRCRPREGGDPYAAVQRCGTGDENNIV